VLPRVPADGHSGKRFSKKRISSPSVALGEEVSKKKVFLTGVLHSGKSKKIRKTALNLHRGGA
jgi:hypothetical protein